MVEGERRTPKRVVLQIGERHPHPVKLQIDGRLTMGRAGTDDGEQPTLDLSPFGAPEHGVSRLHAALSPDGDGIYVEDLNSTNGTRINGYPLRAGRRYRLRNNDELEFGTLRVVVRFLPNTTNLR